ncbi:putative reverse transcriptase domain-containing protein, partial [Tanacetum coccineum]
MSKIRADYELGIARPKIDDRDYFKLKGQFLKELRDNTFNGSDHEDANEHIEKVLEIVDLFHVPNITQDQIMIRVFPISLTRAASRWTRSTKTSDGLAAIQAQLNNLGREIKNVNEKVYAAQVGCEQCKGTHYTKDCPLKEEGKTLEEAYYTQFGAPFQQGGQYRAVERGIGSLPSSTKTNPRDHVKSISTTIEADMTPIRHLGSSQYAVSAQQNSKLMFESRRTTIPFPSHLNDYYCDEKEGINALTDLGASVSVMPLSTYLNLGLGELAHTKLTVELADRTMKHPKGITENVLVGIGKFVFPVDFIILYMPEDVKVTLILGRPFLSIAHAKIDVFKRKITLRVGDEKIIFKSMKPASSLIKRVYMLSLRERMELDLEARLMGETLVLNISLDPLYRDYIELNDLNVPLELRRDQVDDLIPTIEEGE